MALSVSQAAERAYNMALQMADEESSGVSISDVELMIPEALDELYDNVAKSEFYYRIHKTVTNITVTAGIGTLAESVIAETLLPSRGGEITFTRTDVTDPQFRGSLKFMPDIDKLRMPRPGGNQIGYYTIRGGGSSGAARIFVYSGLGVPATGTAAILAGQYISSLASLPTELEGEFISTLAGMVRDKMNQAKAAMPAAEG